MIRQSSPSRFNWQNTKKSINQNFAKIKDTDFLECGKLISKN